MEPSLFAATVFGNPKPQGSKRAVIRGGKSRLIEASEALPAWRDTMLLQFRSAMGEGFQPITEAVEVELQFSLPRPGTAPKTKRVHVTKAPDLDKLCRAVLDSLVNAGVIIDDSYVVDLHLRKRYAVPPTLPKIQLVEDSPVSCVRVRVWKAQDA